MRVWRISLFADLSGQGGMVSEARWNFVGTPIVYCADRPATALLEILVHLDAEDTPPTFQLLEIEIPELVPVATPELPENWPQDVAATQQIGSRFIAAMTHPVMKVPCAIVPFTDNYLLNPALVKQAEIQIVAVSRHAIDARLLA
jgi:RES domain-containing protein